MSSHHFVKEQQEPALLILQAADYNFELVADILEWSPTVLISQDALDKVTSWGIKIDRVIANEDFAEKNSALLQEQFPLEFLIHREGEMWETGLRYLIRSDHDAAVILGYDHIDSDLLKPSLQKLDLVFYDGPIRYVPAKSGTLTKWLAGGSIQLHASENTLIEVRNARGSTIVQVNHATFIEVEEGLTTFKGSDMFWIGEYVGT
nr:thiamine pyrophosphokinase [Cytophagales bacterium]